MCTFWTDGRHGCLTAWLFVLERFASTHRMLLGMLLLVMHHLQDWLALILTTELREHLGKEGAQIESSGHCCSKTENVFSFEKCDAFSYHFQQHLSSFSFTTATSTDWAHLSSWHHLWLLQQPKCCQSTAAAVPVEPDSHRMSALSMSNINGVQFKEQSLRVCQCSPCGRQSVHGLPHPQGTEFL